MKLKQKIIISVIILIMLLSALTLSCIYVWWYRQPQKSVIHIIALGGQSNCEGVALSSALEQKVTNKQYQLYSQGFKNVSIVSVSNGVTSDPIKQCKLGFGTTTNHFGIEIGIADYLNTYYPDNQYCLVKKAVGGTTLGKFWTPSSDTGEYIKQLINGINITIQQYERLGYIVKVDAFCFMQGEEESASGELTNYYNDTLNMINYFRENFKSYGDNIRYIDGGVYHSERFPYGNPVNQIKKSVADTDTNNYYIDTIAMGLTKNNLEESGIDDIFHYDSLSMLRLGWAFGEDIVDNNNVD